MIGDRIMKRLMTLALALVALTMSAAGQWQQLAGPEGGVARTFVEHNGSLLAIMYPNHLYRRSVGSEVWTRIGTLGAENILSIGNVLVASGDSGVVRSTDDGATWNAVDGGDLMLLQTIDRGTIYATRQGLVYRSLDSGATFERFGGNLFEVASGWLEPSAIAAWGDTLLVGGNGDDGIFRSTDDGETWARILPFEGDSLIAPTIGRVGSTFYAFIAKRGVTATYGISVSTDAGATWSQLSDGLPESSYGPLFVYQFYNEAGLVAAATVKGLYMLEDGRWVGVDDGFVTGIGIDDQGRRYRAVLDGVRRSTDGGQTWERANRGLINTTVTALIADGSTLVASAAAGLYRSDDRGLSWQRTGQGWVVEMVRAGGVIVGRGEHGTNVGLVRSTDGGRTWQDANVGIEHPMMALTDIAYGDGSWYASYTDVTHGRRPLDSITGGLYRSTDDGASWSAVGEGLPVHGDTTLAVNHVAVAGRSILAATFHGLHLSYDGGESWSLVGKPAMLNWVHLLTAIDDDFVMVTGTSVHRSSDDGSTWSPVGAQLPGPITSVQRFGDAIVATTGSGISTGRVYVLSNGAWQPHPAALPAGISLNALALADGRLYGATNYNSVISLALTPSGVEDDVTVREIAWAPHPLRDGARIAFTLERPADVSLELVDATGARGLSVGARQYDAGRHEIALPVGELAPGAYGYHLTIDGTRRSGVVIVAE
jgi:hypothetical protein